MLAVGKLEREYLRLAVTPHVDRFEDRVLFSCAPFEEFDEAFERRLGDDVLRAQGIRIR